MRAIALLCCIALPSYAEPVGGIRQELTLGVGVAGGRNLAFEPGPGRQSTKAIGALRYRFTSETRRQSLDFTIDLAPLGGRLEEGASKLSYSINASRATLSFAVGADRLPAGGIDDLHISTERRIGLTPQSGDRDRYFAQGRLRLGQGGSLGSEFHFAHIKRDARGALSNDTQSGHLAAIAHLRFSARRKASVSLESDRFASDLPNAGWRRQRLSISVQEALSPRDSVSFSIGRARARRGVMPAKSGFEFAFGLRRERAAQALSFDAEQRIYVEDRLSRVRLRYERRQRHGALDAWIGFSRFQGKTEPEIGLTLRHANPKWDIALEGSYGMSLPVTAAAPRPASRIAAQIGYALTERGHLQLELNGFASDATPAAPRQTALWAKAAYRHHLSRDLELVGGVQHWLRRDGQSRVRSDRFFISLERRLFGR